MTRDAMEAHLTLHGWQPIGFGWGAAVKDDVVVYAAAGPARKIAHSGIEARTQSTSGLTGTHVKKKTVDEWFMADKYFWVIARACQARDAKQLGATNG